MATPMNAMIPNVASEANMMGRVTRDAEARFTPSGAKVTNLSVAVSRRFQKDEEWKEQTAFFGVAIWGDAADRAQNIKKGDIVMVSFSLADLEARPYTSGDENKAALQINRAQVSRVAWAHGTSNGNSVPSNEAPAVVPA